ncbi:MAG: tetratricopeptide repeat protein [Pirellulaceae bacterium]
MAKGRKARDRKEQKKLDRRRRLDTKQKPNSTPLARQVTPKLADEVDKVYDLIRVRKFAEAEQQLDRLDKRYDRYPAIVEAQLYLYQATEDHERCCQAADRLVKLTPRDPDARRMYAQESMSCGRVGSAGRWDRGPSMPPMRLHHLAVAQCRLGDEKAARSSWKKCLKAMPTHVDARENLDDLDSGQGHAPWSESIGKWIPRAICDNMFGSRSAIGKTEHLDLTNDYPAVAALIPALLDRSDPLGREMAMRMAAADGSPAMLDALQQFALGSRGPDAMRCEALNILGRKGWVDSGPHRFYSRGKWAEIKLFMTEISWETTRCAAPHVQELVETGTEALSNGDFVLAEESLALLVQIAGEDDPTVAMMRFRAHDGVRS